MPWKSQRKLRKFSFSKYGHPVYNIGLVYCQIFGVSKGVLEKCMIFRREGEEVVDGGGVAVKDT